MRASPDQTGTLSVRAVSGNGIYPLAGVLVSVYTEKKENAGVAAQTFTDRAGLTPQIVLQIAGENDKGEYLPGGETFTIELTKDGYQSAVVHGVQLYPLIDTLLTVNLSALPDVPGAKLTPYDREIVS